MRPHLWRAMVPADLTTFKKIAQLFCKNMVCKSDRGKPYNLTVSGSDSAGTAGVMKSSTRQLLYAKWPAVSALQSWPIIACTCGRSMASAPIRKCTSSAFLTCASTSAVPSSRHSSTCAGTYWNMWWMYHLQTPRDYFLLYSQSL